MGHRVGADFFGDFDLLLCNQGPRDRRAQEILPLIDRVGAEHRKHVIADEFLAQVLDEDIFRLDAEQQRLLARGLELLTLAEIGGEGHDLAAVGGLQPLQDDRGVEAAGIGEHHLLHVLAHERSCRIEIGRDTRAFRKSMPLDLIRGRVSVFRSESAQIDYRRKGLLRKRSRGRTGSDLAAAPALHQTIAGPGKPRQRPIDALVGQAGRWPAVDRTSPAQGPCGRLQPWQDRGCR